MCPSSPTSDPYVILSQYIRTKLPIDSANLEHICQAFRYKSIRKNEFMLQEGQYCDLLAFVTKGCFKTYTLTDSGREYILYFAVRNWWLNDINSFHQHTPAQLYIQALEDSEILYINAHDFEALSQTLPLFDRLFRIMSQHFLVSTQRRLLSNLRDSAKDRYLLFCHTYPEIAQRVSNKLIAAYLGISPEMVSIIRKQLRHTRT